MKTILSLLVNMLLILSSIINAQWTQNTGIEGGDVRSLVYDESKIYSGLYGGGVYVSDNNGITWVRSNDGLSYFFIRSMVVKEQYIFAGTASAGVFVSTDQGQSWTAVNGLPNSTVTAMAELDSFIFAGMYNRIYASSDFGQTWFWRSNGLPANSISSFATKDSIIFVGTSDGFYYSSDYGANWIERSNGLSNRSINDLTILDDKIFAAISFDGVYVTYDDGLQWLPAGLSPINILSITSADTTIFAGTFSSGIFTSSDFGNNWFSFNNNYPYGSLTYSLEHIGNSVFAGNESGLYELILGETEWNKRNEGLYAFNPECIVVDNDKIYVGAPGGKIYISSDKGNSWLSSQVSETFASIISIAFKGDTIYTATNGFVYFSTDSAVTWSSTNLSAPQISSIAIKDGNTFVGTSSGIWLSTDGGLTWTQKNNGLTMDYVRKLAIDSVNIYAGTLEGLFISSDFGENWIKAIAGISQTMAVEAIEVVGEKVYVGGIYGIYVSTNYGTSWVFKGLSNRIVQCISGYENLIFAGTFPDGIYRSTNGGNAWQVFNDGLPYKNAISMEVLDSTLFTGILGFGLWNRPLIVTGIEAEQNELPTEFYLSQNFPNPFNPSTTIKYQIPELRFVTLNIYDVLGSEVATLVNEQKPADSYEVQFNGSNLPSGIYFYRIQAGSFIETKKMVLMK